MLTGASSADGDAHWSKQSWRRYSLEQAVLVEMLTEASSAGEMLTEVSSTGGDAHWSLKRAVLGNMFNAHWSKLCWKR